MTFSIFSVVFLSIGIVLYVMSDQIVEIERSYDRDCIAYKKEEEAKGNDPKALCKLDLKNAISTKINGPIYVYYQLDNFYQNHRRYVKSRDNQQLNGQYKNTDQLSNACDPIVKVRDLWENQQINLINQKKCTDNPELEKDKACKEKMGLDDPAIPCGLVAKSYFNDTFELYEKTNKADGTVDLKKKDIESKRIAWSSDLDFKFSNIKKDFPDGITDYKQIQWMDMTDGKLIFFFTFLHLLFFIRALYCLDENRWTSQLQKAVGYDRR